MNARVRYPGRRRAKIKTNEQPPKISFETAGFVVVTLQLASKELRTFWRDENCRVQKELKRVQKSRLALTLTL